MKSRLERTIYSLAVIIVLVGVCLGGCRKVGDSEAACAQVALLSESCVGDSVRTRISERFDSKDIERMDSIRYYLLSKSSDADKLERIMSLMDDIYVQFESEPDSAAVSILVDYIASGIDSLHRYDIEMLKMSQDSYFAFLKYSTYREEARKGIIDDWLRYISRRGKSYHDWCLIDSMLKFGKAKFRHVNSDRLNIIREYLFNCSNEYASEGIADDLGEAFMINDKFYEQIMDLYDSITPAQQEHMIMHLNGAIYFYLDTWAARKHLDIIKFDEFEHWVHSIDNIDTIKQLRADFRQDPYKLLEPWRRR